MKQQTFNLSGNETPDISNIKNKNRQEISKRFMEYFGTSHIFASKLSMLLGYDFDIIEFDAYMKSKGYREEKDGSLADYIQKRYGTDAKNFIVELLNIHN